jgi:hypothetical protein
MVIFINFKIYRLGLYKVLTGVEGAPWSLKCFKKNLKPIAHVDQVDNAAFLVLPSFVPQVGAQ